MTKLLRTHQVTVEPRAAACIDDALAVLAGSMGAKASGEADGAAGTEALQRAACKASFITSMAFTALRRSRSPAPRVQSPHGP